MIRLALDCFGGEILALQMRDNMKKELCIDTVKAAARRYPIRGAILHSDYAEFRIIRIRAASSHQRISQNSAGRITFSRA